MPEDVDCTALNVGKTKRRHVLLKSALHMIDLRSITTYYVTIIRPEGVASASNVTVCLPACVPASLNWSHSF